MPPRIDRPSAGFATPPHGKRQPSSFGDTATSHQPPITAKVFCIGFQKTGTSSLRDALAELGFNVAGVFGRTTPLDQLRKTFVEAGLEVASRHDAVQDMPWPLMFRQLDARFPGARFILTVRDTDRWFQSIEAHFGDRPYHIQQLTYGADAGAPTGNESRYRRVYEAHNAAVRQYFADRPGDLLVMDLERGDGWAQLGEFLGIAVPEGPFIRTNSAQQRETFTARLRKWLHRLGLPVKTIDR
ncbi:sulfotransferase family protein [Tsuneonella mangrovi]|uniref:sulfotransferase family protein n=1 Tax=Tsuneonella mangrovi TaxID=1982042 RepID=UPI000BA1C657|nr:sulfotransferase family protein [Tsuneonella mangrovi]